MWSHVQVIKFKCLEAFNIQIFENFGLLGLTFTLGILSSHKANGDTRSFRLQHSNPLTKLTRANFPKPLMFQKLFHGHKNGPEPRPNSIANSYNNGWTAPAVTGLSQYPPLTPHSCNGLKHADTPSPLITLAQVSKESGSSEKHRSLNDDCGSSLAARSSPTWLRMQKTQLRNDHGVDGPHGLDCNHPDTPIPGHNAKARREIGPLAKGNGSLSSILESSPSAVE